MEAARSPEGPPLLAFVGESGAGKTTLLCGVIASLRARGLKVGVVKHSGGFADPDRPGKDSRRLREAGAERLVLGSRDATVLFHHHPGEEPAFAERLALLGSGLDLVLVESYRGQDLPAIEVLRRERGTVPRLAGSSRLLAVAADFHPQGLEAPVLDLGDPEQVAQFVVRALSLA